MGRITTLSTQRLSATIILLWWDFLCELCNGDASTQITTRLLFFFFFFFSFLSFYLPCLPLEPQTTAQLLSSWCGGGRVHTPSAGRRRRRHGDRVTGRCCPDALRNMNMKYKKFITIMQAALGVAPLNKRELIPPPRKLWKPAR